MAKFLASIFVGFQEQLLSAIERNDVDGVEDLVKDGRDINIYHCGGTPLHYAVESNKLMVVKVLLDAGADPKLPVKFQFLEDINFQFQDLENRNALQIAKIRGLKHIINCLSVHLKKQAPMNSDSTTRKKKHPKKDTKKDTKKRTVPHDQELKDDENYYSTQNPRGIAIVVGNGNVGRIKDSCHEDANKMKDVLRTLGYEVQLYLDVCRIELLTIIHSVSIQDHKDYDSFVLYFSGHGGSNSQGKTVIYGGDAIHHTEKDAVVLEKVADYFRANNCESLAGKPKIFLWDCCRGVKSGGSKGTFSAADAGSQSEGDPNDDVFVPPRYADFLYGYSSAPDYKSYAGKCSDVTNGLSVWTHCLSEILQDAKDNNDNHIHWLDALTRVHRKVPDALKSFRENWHQTPNFVSFLTKHVRILNNKS